MSSFKGVEFFPESSFDLSGLLSFSHEGESILIFVLTPRVSYILPYGLLGSQLHTFG